MWTVVAAELLIKARPSGQSALHTGGDRGRGGLGQGRRTRGEQERGKGDGGGRIRGQTRNVAVKKLVFSPRIWNNLHWNATLEIMVVRTFQLGPCAWFVPPDVYQQTAILYTQHKQGSFHKACQCVILAFVTSLYFSSQGV